jgi:hypothetical protein
MLGRSQGGRQLAGYLRLGSHRRMRAIMLATLVASTGALVATDGAALAATGGLSYPPALLTSVPDAGDTGDGVTSGEVNCPSGHPNPTGGGVDIAGSDPHLDLETKSSAPSVLHNGWDVQANNSSGTDAQMTVFAICTSTHLVYIHKTASIPAGGTRSAKAKCPAGTKVVGGGVSTVGGDHSVEVNSSEPADGNDADHKPDDAWFGTAGNGLGAALTMEVDAVCTSHGHYTVVVGPRTTLPNKSIATSAVACPHGTRVTGGGTEIDRPSTDLEVHDGFPIDGSDADTTRDDGWQSTAYNDGSGSVAHMKTFAICKKV